MTTKYKLGDEVWWIPAGYLIAIKCKITEVESDLCYNGGKLLIRDCIFAYDVDEVVGNCLMEYDFLTKEDAKDVLDTKLIEYLTGRMKEPDNYPHPVNPFVTLDEFRRNRLKFITSTWEDAPEEDKNIDFLLTGYPAKEKDKDWFNCEQYFAKVKQ
jgi:hypothetical protein